MAELPASAAVAGVRHEAQPNRWACLLPHRHLENRVENGVAYAFDANARSEFPASPRILHSVSRFVALLVL